jgi:carbon monoxide dehydrogenase subunit G
MTRLHEEIITATPVEEAFAYTADFNNIQDWDPGVAESRQIGQGPVGNGTRFDLVAVFSSRKIPMVYTIDEFEPPHRVVLVGEGSALTAVDEITFANDSRGTVVTYTADLTFKGLLRFVAPFMGRALEKVGQRAVAGLARQLAALHGA